MKKVHFETTKGEIVAELFEDDAPGTVENFTGLVSGTKTWVDPKSREKVQKPFYDGLTFHRVIANFMVQGGCPQRGSLSMAHAGRDTGGSQFFICHSPQKHLDRKHTVFGQVTSGLEVVDKIQTGDKMTRVWIEE